MINKQGLIPVVITTVVVSILSLSITGQNKPETTFHAKGYLVDIECAVVHDTQGNGNWGVTHNRRCLESEASKRSGFALLLPNGEIYRFDPEGNALALKAIASTKKDNDFRIEVTGVLDNNALRVTSLLLLK